MDLSPRNSPKLDINPVASDVYGVILNEIVVNLSAKSPVLMGFGAEPL